MSKSKRRERVFDDDFEIFGHKTLEGKGSFLAEIAEIESNLLNQSVGFTALTRLAIDNLRAWYEEDSLDTGELWKQDDIQRREEWLRDRYRNQLQAMQEVIGGL